MTAALLRRRWHELLVVVAVVTVVVVMLWPEIDAFRVQPPARRELLAFTSALTLGMPRSEVVGRVNQGGRVHLTVADVDANLVLVQTPFTFGAGSWLAWLDFTNGRLSSIRIRIADSVRIKPTGSPPDVGVPPRP
jgi:hypothetical protein